MHGLHKRYRDAVTVRVSFSVRAGEIFRGLGPNGAEKTTTAECIEGLRGPDRSRVRVCGLDPHRDRRRVPPTGTDQPMHPEIETALLRITQAALVNVAKHAEVQHVGRTLSYTADQVALDSETTESASTSPEQSQRHQPG